MKRAFLFALLIASACVQQPIGDPAGDQNYDDPDDPGNTGQNSSGPDAAGDASGRACASARDCPATMVCAYSIASGCSADAGMCLPFDGGSDPLNCNAPLACGCDGKTEVMLCAPAGYSPEQPVESSVACNSPLDAGVSDSSSDDASDAAPE